MSRKPHHIGARLPPAHAMAVLLALVVLSAPAKGQVTARQADAGDVEIANPMLLEVALPTDLHKLLDAPVYRSERRQRIVTGKAWSTEETARFVVDKARVPIVSVRRGHDIRKREHFLVDIGLVSGWFRQDVDVTVRLLRDGKELRRDFVDDETIGNSSSGAFYAGTSQVLTFDWRVKEGEVDSWFEGADAMALEIKVFVDDD